MTATQEPIVLACAADANYAMPLTVTVCSALINLKQGRKVKLFVLDGGITPSQKRRFDRSIASHPIEVIWTKTSEAWFENLPVSEKYPVSIYYRLLLPRIVSDSVKKIIYLDTDLIIQRDLGQLWDIDLVDNYVLAVPNLCQRYISQTNHLDHKKFGIPEDCKYFNTGVLVINLEKWRSDKVAERAIEFIEQNPDHVLFPDQDALNIVLAGQWAELDPRWNQMHAIHEYTSWKESPYDEETYYQVLHHPYIVHFTTPPKPWQSHCKHPRQDLFFSYLDQTAWRGWRNTIWRRAWRKAVQTIQHLRR